MTNRDKPVWIWACALINFIGAYIASWHQFGGVVLSVCAVVTATLLTYL